jgi:hypothetical protein
MNDVQQALVDFLTVKSSAAQVRVDEEGFCATPLFAMVLRGEAKLPLGRVEEVADRLRCDKHELFRLSMRQFYDETVIGLFERMLAQPVSDKEQMWLEKIRSANERVVVAPSGMPKRLVRALAKAPA